MNFAFYRELAEGYVRFIDLGRAWLLDEQRDVVILL